FPTARKDENPGLATGWMRFRITLSDMRRILVPLVVVALLLSGCSAAQTSAPTKPTVSDASSLIDAVGLVNMWHVRATKGGDNTSYLRLDRGDLLVWTSCGMAMGSWDAGEGSFVSSLYGANNGYCERGHIVGPAWLRSATGYRFDGPGVNLTNANGDVVATLERGGHPPKSKNYTDDWTNAPAITPDVESYFPKAVPLPAEAKHAGDIVGRWIPLTDEKLTRSYIYFYAGGTYAAMDGCNPTNGRWALLPDGRILSTSGLNGQVGCKGTPTDSWLFSASRVGLVDDHLTFYDATGKKLGALERG
ncbi:MAG: hypothetical protein JWR36_443, partial [Glaciihabitans sp.]|nr:hypothetical protein [Glaciihabitans sp.]